MVIRILLVAFGLFAGAVPWVSASCVPTPHRTTGTHYKLVTEQRGDIGSGVTVTGRILAAPDCKPVPNAKVAHWKAGKDGRYADRLRAYRYADAEGRYSFRTEWPDLRPPHIHFIITADGHDILETQWVGRKRVSEIEFDMISRAKCVARWAFSAVSSIKLAGTEQELSPYN